MKKSMLLVSLALSSLLTACGSSSKSSPPPSAIGVWSGNVTVGASSVPVTTALLVDGTARLWAPGGAATGTWTLAGTTVNASVTPDGGGTALTLTGGLTSTTLSGSGTEGAISFTFSLSHPADASVGIWKGKYGLGAAAQTLDMLLLIVPGPIAELYDGATLTATMGSGTWSVTGSVVTAGVAPGGGTPVIQLAGTVAGDAMTGTFGTPPSSTGGGTMTLARQR